MLRQAVQPQNAVSKDVSWLLRAPDAEPNAMYTPSKFNRRRSMMWPPCPACARLTEGPPATEVAGTIQIDGEVRQAAITYAAVLADGDPMNVAGHVIVLKCAICRQ